MRFTCRSVSDAILNSIQYHFTCPNVSRCSFTMNMQETSLSISACGSYKAELSGSISVYREREDVERPLAIRLVRSAMGREVGFQRDDWYSCAESRIG